MFIAGSLGRLRPLGRAGRLAESGQSGPGSLLSLARHAAVAPERAGAPVAAGPGRVEGETHWDAQSLERSIANVPAANMFARLPISTAGGNVDSWELVGKAKTETQQNRRIIRGMWRRMMLARSQCNRAANA